MPYPGLLALPTLLLITVPVGSTPAVPELEPVRVDALIGSLEKLYIDLHQTPELSDHEEKTAEKLAAQLKKLGFTVTTHVGGFGVVGVLRNGDGPTVMLRTDMDALPVEEKTNLPYASRVTTRDDAGTLVHVMHACGHDVHMTVWLGTATVLARSKERWRGTLMMVGQPSEERGSGARRMLQDGLFRRFPRPDFALALHDSPALASGKVSVVPGYALANVDNVDLTIYGHGGHGGAPQTTIDPIVLGARTVLALQTIVSREINPIDSAVITVGSFHAGTKHNVIPDEAQLQITVRSYKEDVRRHILSAIERVARGEAMSAGAPEPRIAISEGTPATFNPPELSQRIERTLASALGPESVVATSPVMGGEDFSEYGRAGVPGVIFWLGASEPRKLEESRTPGGAVPALHSATFAPDRVPTLRTGTLALTAAALDLLAVREDHGPLGRRAN